MEGEKEERKLVTAISELAVGMMVVDVLCACGEEHRDLIVSEGTVVDEDDRDIGIAFEVIGCAPPLPPGKKYIIDAEMVAAGRIYRILDGLDPDKDAFEDSMDDYASNILASAYAIMRGGKVTERERR